MLVFINVYIKILFSGLEYVCTWLWLAGWVYLCVTAVCQMSETKCVCVCVCVCFLLQFQSACVQLGIDTDSVRYIHAVNNNSVT